MSKFTPEQLKFPPVDGMTVRADFVGGALSSDFGHLLLRGIDRHIGLTQTLADAFTDRRHASYIDHSLQGEAGMFALYALGVPSVCAGFRNRPALRRKSCNMHRDPIGLAPPKTVMSILQGLPFAAGQQHVETAGALLNLTRTRQCGIGRKQAV